MAHNIGLAVASRRKDRDIAITAAQLAERMTALGYPYTRAAVANLENGRKNSVDVAELLALASALGVPPAMLIFQTEDAIFNEALPGHYIKPSEAVQWFVGYPPESELDPAFDTHEKYQNESVDLFKQAYATREYKQAISRLEELKASTAPQDEIQQAQRVVDQKWQALEDARGPRITFDEFRRRHQ